LNLDMNAAELGAAPPPVGQAAPEARPEAARQQRPSWHRPGGRYAKRGSRV
jgi:hypothetical protein